MSESATGIEHVVHSVHIQTGSIPEDYDETTVQHVYFHKHFSNKLVLTTRITCGI